MPFEFIVEGPPVSQQSKSRKRVHDWKMYVRRKAGQEWSKNDPPLKQPVKLMITYYYDEVALDVDNMIKPIQDALIGLVYTDDRFVTDTVGRKRRLDGSFRVRGMSPMLARGFCLGKEFLHIKVDKAPDPQELV